MKFFSPPTISATGFLLLPLLLLLSVLEEPAAAALLDDSGLRHLSPEPPEEDLLGLVLVDDDLHVVPRLEVEYVGVAQGRVGDGDGDGGGGDGEGREAEGGGAEVKGGEGEGG